MSEPKDFSELSYFILERLKDLSIKFDTIQRDLTAIQGSQASRTELKELRDHCDREFKAVQDRCDAEAKGTGQRIAALDNSNTELKVKVWFGAAIVSALMAVAVKKLFG